MRKYEKIETIYARDMEGTKKLIPGSFRDETVKFLFNNDWIWTEKVDGTNIRVMWDGHNVSFGGRTDNAVIPTPLMDYLNAKFGTPETEELFEQMFGEREVVIFGEGYGNKIQKVGHDYIPDGVGFIMFDLLIGDNYQPLDCALDCAVAFDIPYVPVIKTGPLSEAIEYVKEHHDSVLANGRCEMEGLVCRPACELRDRCGNRVIVKIKWRDFKEVE